MVQEMLEGQGGHKTLAGRVKPPACPRLQEDMAPWLTGWLAWAVGTSIGMERGTRQWGESPAPSQPQPPAPHLHLQDLVQTKCPDTDTLMVVPTRSFVCKSNSLARKGLGRAFEAFGGCKRAADVPVPHPRSCLCLAQQARQIHHGFAFTALSSPPPAKAAPREENNLKEWERGPKAQG